MSLWMQIYVGTLVAAAGVLLMIGAKKLCETRRGWELAWIYFAVLGVCAALRETLPEHVRDAIITPLMMVPFTVFLFACIACIWPIPSLWMDTRKQAFQTAILAAVLLFTFSLIAPTPNTFDNKHFNGKIIEEIQP